MAEEQTKFRKILSLKEVWECPENQRQKRHNYVFWIIRGSDIFPRKCLKILADHASLDVIKKIADDDNNEMQTDIERGVN